MSKEIEAALRVAAAQTAKKPSEAQIESGNYAKGRLRIHGLGVSLENPKGSTRSGVDKGGKRWSVRMPAHYGYVRGTQGRDGDHVDVYIGPDHASDKVFVVDQVDAASRRFDEHKCMLSYSSKSAALADYERAFSDGKGRDRIGAVTEMTVPAFREWLASGDTKRPAGDLRKGFATGGSVDVTGTNKGSIDKALAAASRLRRAAGGAVRGYADGGGADWRSDMDVASPFDLRGSAPEARSAGRYDRVRPLPERAGSAALDYGPLPAKIATEIIKQPIRAGEALGEAAHDPSIANFGNAAWETALTFGKPVHGLKMLGAAYGAAAAKDAGVLDALISKAGAQGAGADGLTGAQTNRLRSLERKSTKQGLTRAEREEQQLLMSIQRDFMLEMAKVLGRQKVLEAEGDAEAKASRQREYDAAVARAVAARDEALKKDVRFATSDVGRLYEKSGGLLPFIAGLGGGVVHGLKGFDEGASALRRLGVPAAEGTGLAFAAINAPLAYDAFSAPRLNPQREAVEAYARELPPEHPRKAEYAGYAADEKMFPRMNPVQQEAWREFTDPVGMMKRLGTSAVEGASAGILGSFIPDATRSLVLAPIRTGAAIPGAAAESYFKEMAKASAAKDSALATRKLSEGVLGTRDQARLPTGASDPRSSVGTGDIALPSPALPVGAPAHPALLPGSHQSSISTSGAPLRPASPSPGDNIGGGLRSGQTDQTVNIGSRGPTLIAPPRNQDRLPPVVRGGPTFVPGEKERNHPHMSHPARPKDAVGFNPSTGRYHAADGRFLSGPPIDAPATPATAGAKLPERQTGGAVQMGLDVARGYTHGGAVHVGPVMGETGGREDALPISVPAGSFVVPADIVSSLGEGNTGAGMKRLEATFGKPSPHAAMASGGSAPVPIKISDGEFVLSPEQVLQIGQGDMARGHKTLDKLVLALRKQHIDTLSKLPPPSKG